MSGANLPRAKAFVALMYHNVHQAGRAPDGVGPAADAYFVDDQTFGRHLDTIDAKACCLNVDELRAFYDSSVTTGHSASAHPLVITFDDGWRGSVEVAGPMLESHGIHGLLFVTCEHLGRRHFIDNSDLPRLPRSLYTVGSHGKTHRMFSALAEDEVRAELKESKVYLEDATGYEVDCVSIPNGAVDRRVRLIAAECGYRYLFDSYVRVNRRGASPMHIGRVAIRRTTTDEQVDAYVRHRLFREQVRATVLGVPKKVLGVKGYDRLRRALLGDGRRIIASQNGTC